MKVQTTSMQSTNFYSVKIGCSSEVFYIHRKIPCEEIEVKDMSFNYLLEVRPWRIEEQDAFQNDVQAPFIELVTEVHPRNLKGGDKDRYKEVNKAFTHSVYRETPRGVQFRVTRSC